MRFLIFLILFINPNLFAYEVNGKVIGIIDGDSITILDKNKKQQEIRLNGIDAPEMGQEFGKNAKKMLSNFIFAKQVRADCIEIDKYSRHVCTLYFNSGEEDIDINAAMVANGGAWVYTKYYDGESYYALEKIAKNGNLGLWQDKYYSVPPWEWRDGNYNQQAIQQKNNPTSNGSVVKMSKSRICHDTNSRYYSRTKNYTAYKTLKECLNAGGRLPKK